MTQGKRLTAHDEARIVRMIKVQSINAVARELGHSRNTIKRILKKYSKSA